MPSYSVNEDRFWSKVDKQDGCWLWTAAKHSGGYGAFNVTLNGKPRAAVAHRVSYELCVGPIPEGMLLDHICFNKLCVNPSHLRPVTSKQNMEHRQGAHVNSKSGVRGVSWEKRARKWIVRITHHSKSIYVGTYSDLRDAEAAAVSMRNELFTHNDES